MDLVPQLCPLIIDLELWKNNSSEGKGKTQQVSIVRGKSKANILIDLQQMLLNSVWKGSVMGTHASTPLHSSPSCPEHLLRPQKEQRTLPRETMKRDPLPSNANFFQWLAFIYSTYDCTLCFREHDLIYFCLYPFNRQLYYNGFLLCLGLVIS